MDNEPQSTSATDLVLDELFLGQDTAASHNLANSEVVQRRLGFLREAVSIAWKALSTLPFTDEKQHAIRVLSTDGWSSLITSIRVGLWGNAPESLALLRCGVETAAILSAVVENHRYKTAVSEFAKRQRQLSFGDSVKLLGDRGKRIARLHGDLSELGGHATGNRMRFAAYRHEGEQFDRFGCALDPEAAAISLRYTLDLSVHLLGSLELAYIQDSKAFPQARELERLRSRFASASDW
jgi:hypothetical protein